MRKMRKGGITRLVSDREAQYLASNGYTEVKAEKKPQGAPKKEEKKE